MSKRYLQVFEELRGRIARGELGAGAQLPTERHLAAHFAVSRTTVREALLALEMAGLVDIRGRTGVFSRPPRGPEPAAVDADEPTPFEVVEARLALEPEVAAAAAAGARSADIAAIEGAIAAMVAEETSGEREERADRRFHLAVAQATGNPILANVVALLWAQADSAPWRRALQLVRTAERRSVWIAEHRLVLAAIRGGDRSAARKAMRAHIAHVKRVMLTNELGDAAR